MNCLRPLTRGRLCTRILCKLLVASALFAVYYGVMITFSKHSHRIVNTAVTSLNLIQATPSLTVTATPRRTITANAVGCVHPTLELWPPSFKQFFGPPKPLECSKVEQNWVYAENGTFQISSTAIKRHGVIRCAYTPLYHGGDDFHTRWGDTVADFRSGSPLKTDFFKVACSANDNAKYNNIHAGIAPVKPPTVAPTTGPQTSLDLNILMIGFDSVSRMTWQRNLPKTYEHLVKVLGAVVLEGYNIVGDGTPQALLPMLTGKTELELPEARRSHKGAKPVNGHPWIWKDFKKLGYVTQYAEDLCNIGTFTYRMLGFKDPPVDHYMRTYFLESEKLGGRNKPLCIGSLARHNVFIDYARDLHRTYPKSVRKFTFVFNSEMSHDSHNRLQLADDDLVAYLKDMTDGGQLDDTLLIMMADHGARFSAVRRFVQGKHEERNPFMSFRFPPSFEKKHPDAMKNLRTNVHRLSTPFDVHATLRDIYNYSGVPVGDVKQRGISLFSEIPENRTCKQADIEPHWCTCLTWTKMDTGDPKVKRSVAALLTTINNQTQSQRAKCETLALQEVRLAVRYAPNESVLKFKQSADNDGYVADLSDKMKANYEMYQVTISTKPGEAEYEATVTHLLKNDTYTLKLTDISRINKYGNQPHCIMAEFPLLRPYCYCKVQLK